MKDHESTYKDLSRQEIQVALALRTFHRKNQPVEESELSKYCYRVFGKYLVNIQSGLQLLKEKKLIILEDAKYKLTGQGIDLVEYIQQIHPIWIYYFNHFYESAENSKAYAEFAEKTYGRNLYQQGQMDMEQLELLINELDIKSNHKVLEIGCGNGYITEYIHKLKGCNVKGIDISDLAINRARIRTKEMPGLDFEIQNMNSLSQINTTYDKIISIDTLHLAADLEVVISAMIRCLKRSGMIGVFWESWIKKTDDDELLLSKNTRFGKMITKLDLNVSVLDITKENYRHWNKRKATLLELKKDFLAEGNEKLYNMLFNETKRLETSKGTRYLYIIKR